MQIDITVSHDISCMDIAHLGGGNQGEVLVCGEKTGTLQSVMVIGLYMYINKAWHGKSGMPLTSCLICI